MKIWRKRRLSGTSRFLLLLVLLLSLTLFLAGCARTISDCPPYPVAGPAVAGELEKVCYVKDQAVCPHLFSWLDRVGKLRDQLKACQ